MIPAPWAMAINNPETRAAYYTIKLQNNFYSLYKDEIHSTVFRFSLYPEIFLVQLFK